MGVRASPMDQRRLQRLVAVLMVPAAIAVAGALVALRLHFQPPLVPPYFAAGTGPDEQRIARESLFEVELRPGEPVAGAIGARAFLLHGLHAPDGTHGDEVRPWDPPFDVDRAGVVRIRGPAEALFAGVPDGPWEVAVAVGRPEVLPTAPLDVLRERGRDAGTRAAWRLVTVPIRLEGGTR
jgi:hypothetical protein